MKNIVARLREFIDNEAKSCSMDFGCITPEYVHRMWAIWRIMHGFSLWARYGSAHRLSVMDYVQHREDNKPRN